MLWLHPPCRRPPPVCCSRFARPRLRLIAAQPAASSLPHLSFPFPLFSTGSAGCSPLSRSLAAGYCSPPTPHPPAPRSPPLPPCSSPLAPSRRWAGRHCPPLVPRPTPPQRPSSACCRPSARALLVTSHRSCVSSSSMPPPPPLTAPLALLAGLFFAAASLRRRLLSGVVPSAARPLFPC